MRVTNNMLARNVLQNLQVNLARMQKYQNQLSSGRSVSRPSDNPLSTVRIMGLTTRLETGEQYRKNIDMSLSWLTTTESALAGINNIMQRVRELAIYGASGTLSADDRATIVDEVKQLRGNLMQVANSDIEGRYVFAGFNTADVPFVEEGDPVEVVYKGDGGKMQWEIAPGVTMEVNINGNNFEEDETGDKINVFFDALLFLEEKLRSGETEKLSGEAIEKIDKAITRVLNLRSEVGAKMNRLEMATSRNFEEKINMTGLRSSLYDIDMAEILINYRIQESVYHASLSTGARSIQPSLVDFLR